MRYIFNFFVSITLLHAFEEEKLTQYPDGHVWYYTESSILGKKYAISFDVAKPENGTIGELNGNTVKAYIENETIKHCTTVPYNSMYSNKDSTEYTSLILLYGIVKHNFETKQKNNQLPPIQQFK